MVVTFEKLFSTKEDLMSMDRTSPYNVVAMYVNAICTYTLEKASVFYDMLQYLLGDFQQLSELAKQNIKDRMMQNNKYGFIGKSYFIGSSPDNDYTPNVPYSIEVVENEYTDQEAGYKRLFVKSSGADSLRPITVRIAKDGNYYIWSDSYMGLLSDIRQPESTNPWA